MRDIRVDNITQSPGCDLLEHVRLFDNVCVQLVMTSQYVPHSYIYKSQKMSYKSPKSKNSKPHSNMIYLS